MGLFKKTKIVEYYIGPETDEYLYERVTNLLLRQGAEKIGSSDAHGGSQDIKVVSFLLQGSKVKLVQETYVGLSIVGERQIIDSVIAELKSAGEP